MAYVDITQDFPQAAQPTVSPLALHSYPSTEGGGREVSEMECGSKGGRARMKRGRGTYE